MKGVMWGGGGGHKVSARVGRRGEAKRGNVGGGEGERMRLLVGVGNVGR